MPRGSSWRVTVRASRSRFPTVGRPRHFLYVGDDEPRKDLGTLLARMRSTAPLPGAPNRSIWCWRGRRRRTVRACGSSTTSTPAQLGVLHAGAAALVHPALYEGFGLPPLEAMRAGTPVIAARAGGVEEVCGDAALLVPAGDVEGFAQAMSSVAGSPELREQLAARGRERATGFSWAASAREHVAAYSLALES